jgi:NitT/TauT family transport system substrate-binding protein
MNRQFACTNYSRQLCLRRRNGRYQPRTSLLALGMAMTLLAACGSTTSTPPSASPALSAKPASAAAATSGAPAPSGITTVKVSYNTAAATDVPFFVAQDQGYFQKEGINATSVSMTPQVAIVALSKGEIDFMNANAVEGAAKGFPFKIVWDSWSGAAWTIVGKKDITSPQQLKGKLIATNNPGTAPYAYFQAGLKKAGLALRDVQYVPASGTAAVYASILAGKVDAGVLSTPSDGQAEEQGFHEILFLGDLLEFPSNGLAATTDYIAQHRPIVVGMIRAMWAAEQWMKAHPDETQALIAKHLQISPAVAKRTYGRMAPLLTKTGESSLAGVRENLSLIEQAGGTKINMDPAQFADYGPLHEALGQ